RATRTSPGPGSRSPTSTIATGRLSPWKTAAFMASSCPRIADAEHAAGPRPGEPSLLDDRLAVHQHADDALGQDLPALLVAWQVAYELLLAERDARRIEEHEVRVVAASDQAPALQTGHHGRQVGDLAHAFLEREELPLEQPGAEVVGRPLRAVV